jgi:hypothetical protein
LELGLKTKYRDVREEDGMSTLRQPMMPYMPVFDDESNPLSPNNAVLWERTLEITETKSGPTRCWIA